MAVSIEIRCDHCRGDNLSIPLDACEDTMVDCEDCGAELGTLADVKTMVSLKLLGRKKVVALFPHWDRLSSQAARRARH